jgi:hypothetical protein
MGTKERLDQIKELTTKELDRFLEEFYKAIFSKMEGFKTALLEYGLN